MLSKTSKAFSPAGISSFFEICDMTTNGKPIRNLERVGARGGGFGTQKGVTTEVHVSETKMSDVHVFINGKSAPEAETTKTVVQLLLAKVSEKYKVTVRHNVEIPIGAGFGSSAGGALTTALALSQALDLKLTYNQLGRIAHVAEVKCKTGLGTVGPLMLGGCVLTIEPGAPGAAVIDRIPISSDHVIVAGVFGPTPTKAVLSSPERRSAVNKWGRKTLERILSEPSLENFLSCCREFAEKTGFTTERVRTLMRLADKAKAIGAAQNMVGEAVHALTTLENAENVVQAFKQVLPPNKILTAQVDLQGARLIGRN
jgi:pantoate kinase